MDEKLYYSNGPSEWEYRQLGDVVTFQGGSQPPKKYFSNEKLDGMIRLIQIRDYKSNSFKTYVPKELCRRFCNSDDIMIGRYGPPIFQILRGIDGAYNVALIKATANEEVLNKEYLYYFIKNEHLFKLIDGLSQRTSGQTGIDMEVLKKYIIPIPSKAEQEKIASILSTVDEQIDNVEALIEKNKELKKGLMQTLLTKGIGHTKFKRTEIGEIPEEWEVKSLDDFNISNSYGPRFSSDLYDECGNCKVIRGTDVIRNGKVQYKGIPYANIDNQILETHKLIKNDFVVVTTADCGMSFVFNDNGTYMPSAYMVRIRFNDNINPYFVNKFFETKVIRRQVEQHIRKGTIANLPGSDLLKFKIYVPSLLEQEKIVSILSEVDKKIEEYENKKQKLEELKKGLMQQLLTGKIRVN